MAVQPLQGLPILNKSPNKKDAAATKESQSTGNSPSPSGASKDLKKDDAGSTNPFASPPLIAKLPDLPQDNKKDDKKDDKKPPSPENGTFRAAVMPSPALPGFGSPKQDKSAADSKSPDSPQDNKKDDKKPLSSESGTFRAAVMPSPALPGFGDAKQDKSTADPKPPTPNSTEDSKKKSGVAKYGDGSAPSGHGEGCGDPTHHHHYHKEGAPDNSSNTGTGTGVQDKGLGSPSFSTAHERR